MTDDLTPQAVVRVICDDASHRRPGKDVQRVAVVAVFLRDNTGAWINRDPWSIKGLQKAIHPSRAADPGPADKPNPRQVVVGESGPNHDGPPRDRWNLRCELCRFTVPVRDERLQPLLDALAMHGVSHVSLSGIAARLQK